MRALLFVLAATAVAPVCAQTYKWVDERGVTNYSNVPPAARPAQATPIEERVSVIPRDPNLAAATAAAQAQSARRAEYAHQEWLARYQGMMQTQALAAMAPPPADYAPRFVYGYRATPTIIVTRVVRKPVAPRAVARASVRRL